MSKYEIKRRTTGVTGPLSAVQYFSCRFGFMRDFDGRLEPLRYYVETVAAGLCRLSATSGTKWGWQRGEIALIHFRPLPSLSDVITKVVVPYKTGRCMHRHVLYFIWGPILS